MNISTTFLNALKHTSSDVEGQRYPEILLGQIYKVSLEDKGFLLPLAGGEFRLLNPFYYEWNPFPSYLLLYTLEGSALLTTRDNEVILDHEHLLFLDCSQGFSLRLLQGKWRFQMFFLSGRELSSYYSIFEAYFTCCYPIPIGSCVSQRMQQLTKFPFTPTPAEQLQIHRDDGVDLIQQVAHQCRKGKGPQQGDRLALCHIQIFLHAHPPLHQKAPSECPQARNPGFRGVPVCSTPKEPLLI